MKNENYEIRLNKKYHDCFAESLHSEKLTESERRVLAAILVECLKNDPDIPEYLLSIIKDVYRQEFPGAFKDFMRFIPGTAFCMPNDTENWGLLLCAPVFSYKIYHRNGITIMTEKQLVDAGWWYSPNQGMDWYNMKGEKVQ